MNFSTWLNRLHLHSLEDQDEAGLCITSLPWPNEKLPATFTLGGNPAGSLPLGCWPKSDHPRRVLLFADNATGAAPSSLSLESRPFQKGKADLRRPTAEMELFEQLESESYYWERHLLRLRGYGRSIGIAMGLRCERGIHWWEACGLTILRETPHFTEIEMAGSIGHHEMTEEEFHKNLGYHNPYLHCHNWLSGHLYARLHVNGVCEIYAHHINSKFADDGRDLSGLVPVIGFMTDGNEAAETTGPWDGTRDLLDLAGVRLDLREVARLATPAQPGEITHDGHFLVLQPYAGAELYGGLCPEARTGDPFIFRAEQRVFPRGMARTLRFSLSLSDRSPVIARYLAPAWWYGVCEEFLPAPLLPVSNVLDSAITEAHDWVREVQLQGGFEDGAVPRHVGAPREAGGRTRHEPGWEGEIAYAQFLAAWRSGNAGEYQDALRSAYCFTDVNIDHAAKSVRMHGYPPTAFSLPMNRVQSTVAAYLETGDPYLREAARAVTANSHWQHKNSWPRMAVGRDACYVRSAVLLYRYFGEEFYRDIAHEGALAVALSQRPNGSFGDQGGGSGIHQWSGYISKPWMGLLALNGVLDYLELFPDEPRLRQAVYKFARWLMEERQGSNGAKGWRYQHDYRGKRSYFNPIIGTDVALPTNDSWHHATLARLLGFCTLTSGNPAYLEAWAESWANTDQEKGDHAAAATLQFIPWLQARLWNARLLQDGTFSVAPHPFGDAFPKEATILAPGGCVPVTNEKSSPAIPALLAV